MTDSMRRAMDETSRRREIQSAYNVENGITPQSIVKPVDMSLVRISEADYVTIPVDDPAPENLLTPEQRKEYIATLEGKMREAARRFEFEKAAEFRDKIRSVKNLATL
jgi:excinuclease ABC subunit B